MQIDEALLKRVDENVLPTLNYKDIYHPKLIVAFSGPPSVGKSTIAKQLEHELKAIRLENDVVRTFAAKWFPETTLDERSALSHQYSAYGWPKLAQELPNGLWIVDSSIDINYEKFFKFAKDNGFQTFVIALDVPEDLHKEWIIKGGDRPFATMYMYLENMKLRREQQAEFLALHTPDIVLRQPCDVEGLVEVIEQRLEEIK